MSGLTLTFFCCFKGKLRHLSVPGGAVGVSIPLVLQVLSHLDIPPSGISRSVLRPWDGSGGCRGLGGVPLWVFPILGCTSRERGQGRGQEELSHEPGGSVGGRRSGVTGWEKLLTGRWVINEQTGLTRGWGWHGKVAQGGGGTGLRGAVAGLGQALAQPLGMFRWSVSCWSWADGVLGWWHWVNGVLRWWHWAAVALG